MVDTAARYQIDDQRWFTIFAILSLDVAAPFTSQMGLQLPPGEGFIHGLRSIIEEFRSAEARQVAVEAPFSRAAFNWAASEFGSAFADHLYAWGKEVFQGGGPEGVDVFIWNNVVRRGGLDGMRDQHKPLDFVVVLRGMLAKRTKKSVNLLLPASEWDKSVYERQRYDQFRSPMELVQATISHFDFVSAWEEAVAASGQPDLEELHEWGTREAVLLGMPLDRIRKPGNWPPLPPPWR